MSKSKADWTVYVSAASSADMRLCTEGPHQNFKPDGAPSQKLLIAGACATVEATVSDGWEIYLEVDDGDVLGTTSLTRAQALELARWLTETLK